MQQGPEFTAFFFYTEREGTQNLTPKPRAFYLKLDPIQMTVSLFFFLTHTHLKI